MPMEWRRIGKAGGNSYSYEMSIPTDGNGSRVLLGCLGEEESLHLVRGGTLWQPRVCAEEDIVCRFTHTYLARGKP